MKRLLECVPNFSEGRDSALIDSIVAVIEAADGVELLDVDPGAATNRTVVTFVGEPEAVLDAAVAAGKKSAELIDMSKHSGEHPRFGCMDVCPLVPIAGLSMEETADYARELGRRLGVEAGLTVYLYENAASRPERQNLAVVRQGEYEGLKERLAQPDWAPDFGPATFQPKTGATAVSARNFLVAYNINLNTTSARRANAVAFDVREKGRIKREPCPLTGEVVRDADGNPVWVAGELKAVKGIGWFIEEFGIAQVSMNLTDITITSVHEAFDAVCASAQRRGMRATGSELVGLIPLQAMLDAGRHYLRKQQRSTGVSDAELVKIAAKSLGLDDLKAFDPQASIIEYVLAAKQGGGRLAAMSVKAFVEETASESPAPGGGSVAANLGALGAALGTMVANLSSHKRGWDERWEEFSDWAERGKVCHQELVSLIDKDTEAFERIMAAWRLPTATDAEKSAQAEAVQTATVFAIETPLRVMEVSLQSMEVAKAMADVGMDASASDAGVAALCARSAVIGAFLNVRINAKDLSDPALVAGFEKRGLKMVEQAQALEAEILALVDQKVS
jgi:glutamate formiminotransferase/formiminotetrahydrofolate cyclodeaminase